VEFAQIMALEPHGPDTFVGTGPSYPWGGLYGGQIVAQALRAATATVPDEFLVHSLHAYFIRAGNSAEPIRFEVDRLRNGRTFVTRNVVVRQPVGAILNMAASFQVPEVSPEVQSAQMGTLPDPEGLPAFPWSPVLERRLVPTGGEPGRAIGWMRMLDPIGDDPGLQACALAYLSDDVPTEAVLALHPDHDPQWRPDTGTDFPFWNASLDHTIWFHHPLRTEDWHVHDFTCHGLMSSRGLAVGHVFTAGGLHVASVSQEVLIRAPRR
jgi:acyl-CoA thioesterase II